MIIVQASKKDAVYTYVHVFVKQRRSVLAPLPTKPKTFETSVSFNTKGSALCLQKKKISSGLHAKAVKIEC